MKLSRLAPLVASVAVFPAAHADLPPLAPSTAIEYYHAGFDHYFMTSLPPEIAALDSGQLTGWSRTGRGFSIFTVPPPAPFPIGAVCRFYIPPQHGDSHFFSASSDECAAVRARIGTDPNYSGYIEETSQAFYVALPNFGSGA